MERLERGLNNNQLKIIAMIAMCLDHVGLYLFPDVVWFRMVGRLAFPVFAYMIAEGCRHTKHRGRYLAQLFGLGLVCQVVFFVATREWHLGILITFSLAVALIYAIDFYRERKNLQRFSLMLAMALVVAFLSVVAPVWFGERGYGLDYELYGVLLPVLVYFCSTKLEKLFAAAAVLLVMCAIDGGVHWFSMLALPLLFLYDGRRGRVKMKYVFYVFYPLHLAAIYLIGEWVRTGNPFGGF